MKSIKNTLKLVDDIVKLLSKHGEVNISLIGGYSVIAHGVERTTVDVDFYIYTDTIHRENTSVFVELLKRVVPENFEVKFMKGSKDIEDPFKHDVIFIHDRGGEYSRIDFIVPIYKWELEGIKAAKPLEDIPFPVLSKPYLIATKLRAGSLKDDYDITELYKLLTEEEKKKTLELAKTIKRDKKLDRLINPPAIEESLEQDTEETIKSSE